MRKRKLVTLLLTGMMLFSLTACGKTKDENTNSDIPNPTKKAIATVAPTTAPTEAYY